MGFISDCFKDSTLGRWGQLSIEQKQAEIFSTINFFMCLVDFTLFTVILGALGGNWYVVFFLYFDMAFTIIASLAYKIKNVALVMTVCHTAMVMTIFSVWIYFVYAIFYDTLEGTIIFDMSVNYFTISLTFFNAYYLFFSALVLYFGLMVHNSVKNCPEALKEDFPSVNRDSTDIENLNYD